MSLVDFPTSDKFRAVIFCALRYSAKEVPTMARPSSVLGSFTMQDLRTFMSEGEYPKGMTEFLALALRQFAALYEGSLVNFYAVGGAEENIKQVEVLPSQHGNDIPSYRLVAERPAREVAAERRTRFSAERAARAVTPAPAALTATIGEATASPKKTTTKKAAKK